MNTKARRPFTHASSMQTIENTVQRWLEEVVIGLNLCPFAAKPQRKQQIRISISTASTEQQLLSDLQAELVLLDSTAPSTLETTLLIIPSMLSEFGEYNQFLDLTDALLQQYSWLGHYQIASFHPHYRFAGTSSDDAENLTNRSPYPILHILREASLEQALQNHPVPEHVPEININKIKRLSLNDVQKHFWYLFLGD